MLDKEKSCQEDSGLAERFNTVRSGNMAAVPATVSTTGENPDIWGREQGTFDIEQAINLKPDVIIMNMDARNAIVDSGYEAALASAGIPIVYVDFRYDPIAHIPPTVKLFGELFGQSERSEAYLKFRE